MHCCWCKKIADQDGPRSQRENDRVGCGQDVNGTATRAWVDLNGGDGKSLQLIELRPIEQLAALDSGRIDAVVVKPPYLTAALNSGKFRAHRKAARRYRTALSPFVLCRERRLTSRKTPTVINGFRAALAEAARCTNANQAATNDLIAAFTGQDPALLGSGIRSVTAEAVSLTDLQRPLDFAFKNGLLDHNFDVTGILAAGFPLTR